MGGLGKIVAAVTVAMCLAGCSETVAIPPPKPVQFNVTTAVKPLPVKPPVARTVWEGKPDSSEVPTVEDTGQPATQTGGGTPKIEAGLFTFDGEGGVYREFDAGQPVTRIGARFVLGHATGSTAGGAIGLVMMNERLDLTSPTISLNVHAVIAAGGWGISYFSGGEFTDIAGGLFDPPLRMDNTVYGAELYRVFDKVVLVLPDGKVVVSVDKLYDTGVGNWGFVQVTRAASTDNIVGIVEHWWDVGPQRAPPQK